jgi:hypothetical protein
MSKNFVRKPFNLSEDNPTWCIFSDVNQEVINLIDSVVCLIVEDIGVEPITSCLQGRRSSQMS